MASRGGADEAEAAAAVAARRAPAAPAPVPPAADVGTAGACAGCSTRRRSSMALISAWLTGAAAGGTRGAGAGAAAATPPRPPPRGGDGEDRRLKPGLWLRRRAGVGGLGLRRRGVGVGGLGGRRAGGASARRGQQWQLYPCFWVEEREIPRTLVIEALIYMALYRRAENVTRCGGLNVLFETDA